MIDKALMIIIFCYVMSGTLLAGQIVIASTYNIELVSYDGVVVSSYLAGFMNESEFNTRTNNIVEANYTGNSTAYDRVETSTTAAAYIGWELVQILTGTYIFNIMYLMGVPAQFVAVFVIAYVLLLARAVIGYIRGV